MIDLKTDEWRRLLELLRDHKDDPAVQKFQSEVQNDLLMWGWNEDSKEKNGWA